MVARRRLLLVTLVARGTSLELSLCASFAHSFSCHGLTSILVETSIHVICQRVVLFMASSHLHARPNRRCRLGISCCTAGDTRILLERRGSLGRGLRCQIVALPLACTCR